MTSPVTSHFFPISIFIDAFVNTFLKQIVDYDAGQVEMTISVEVCDPDFCDNADITFHIYDVNDNAPLFNPNLVEVQLAEDVQIGRYVTTFTASDADTDPINKEFQYVVYFLFDWLVINCLSVKHSQN